MKFVLNTSIDPHFCFLAEDSGEIVDLCVWENRRRDGKEIFAFLEKHADVKEKIDFLGGVSGPGGFSSLRAGAGVLNALSITQKVQTHSIRADQWVAGLLDTPFVLNSFGDGVFVPKNGKLERVLLADASGLLKMESIYVGLLPEEKQVRFFSPDQREIDLTSKDSLQTLLILLEKENAQDLFVPTYEVNAV